MFYKTDFIFKRELSKKSLFLISISLVILLSYILINIDIRINDYDVEPDYFMNILMIEKFGLPTNIYHPGTIHYYLLYVLFDLLRVFNLNLVDLILSIRVLYFIFGIGLSYLCFSKKPIFILMCFLFVTMLNSTSMIGLVSGESINFFLSLDFPPNAVDRIEIQ